MSLKKVGLHDLQTAEIEVMQQTHTIKSMLPVIMHNYSKIHGLSAHDSASNIVVANYRGLYMNNITMF